MLFLRPVNSVSFFKDPVPYFKKVEFKNNRFIGI